VLQPGKKQEITYTIFAKEKGTFSARATVKADAMEPVNSSWTVVVGQALLDVKMSGPERSYLSQPAVYQISVRNTGTIPLSNVTIVLSVPQSVSVVKATLGGEKFKDRFQWIISSLPAGAMRSFNVSVSAATAGRIELITEALAKGAKGQANVGTEFQGVAALRMKLDASSNP